QRGGDTIRFRPTTVPAVFDVVDQAHGDVGLPREIRFAAHIPPAAEGDRGDGRRDRRVSGATGSCCDAGERIDGRGNQGRRVGRIVGQAGAVGGQRDRDRFGRDRRGERLVEAHPSDDAN